MGRLAKGTLDVYLVTDRKTAGGKSIEDIVEEGVKGGVTIVQLREKELSAKEFVRQGKSLKKLLARYDIPLIINDSVEVALACNADGVHLGQSDMSPAEARRMLGPDRIIGLSVVNFDQVQQAQSLDIDYIAASPVYNTDTKTDTKTEFLVEGVKKMVRMSSLPVIGIGRMNAETAGDVILAGAEGVAVVSAIIGAEDPRSAAEKISEVVESAKLERALASGKRVKWSSLAHFCSKDILWNIRKQSFFAGMRSGKLKYHNFNTFMLQNEWLLKRYTQLMRYMEVRMESSDTSDRINSVVLELVRHFQSETYPETSDMHSFYLVNTPGLKSEDVPEVCINLYEFLEDEVRRSPVPVAIAAMLSLPFLLSRLGRYFNSHSDNESNRYIAWVNLYASQEFAYDVNRFSEIADTLAASSGAHQKLRMLKAFRKGSKLFLELWKSQK